MAGLQFFLDGAAWGGVVTAAPFTARWDSTTVANGSHTLAAKATDTAGNSTMSAGVSFTVNNVQPPRVSVTNPTANSTVSGAIAVSATASDSLGVTGVQFYLDGAALGSQVTAAPYTVSLNTKQLANGSHTLAATATDTAGTSATSPAVSFTVFNDTQPPTVSVTGPTSNSTASRAVTFSATASDNVGVTGLQFYLDGTAWGSVYTAAPYTASWDSTTVGNGTHTLAAKAWDAAGNTTMSSAVSFTVNNHAPNTDPYIVTPYLTIPNFGASPNIVSVKSGNWSDPTVWSLGRLPAAGDIVDINPDTSVTYDVNDSSAAATLNTVEIQATAKLTFRTDVTTQLNVVNLVVLPAGELDIGTQASPVAANVTAQVVFANQALNTTLDPAQFGNGLIGLGTVNMYGTAKAPYVTLSQEALAGATVLHLAAPAAGWAAGDKLQLPDTRQLDATTDGSSYQAQWETVTIQGVSADGRTVTLTGALQFNHRGAHDATGALQYLPQVLNMTRNVSVHSQSATGTRGYVLFTNRANVNVNYAGFGGLGRTTHSAFDDTTFGAGGQATHVGTNQENRNAITFLDLFGPTSPQADGYQYTFVGNTVTCPLSPMPFIWGINVTNSYYGLIQGNDVVNWNGAGVFVDSRSSYNTFDGNFVLRVQGTGGRTDQWLQGDAYWFGNPNNTITNNVASDINGGAGNNYGYGYDVDASYVGTVTVPAFQGADPAVSGRSVNMNALPLLNFANNEVYGATLDGMTYWWLGSNWETPLASGGTIDHLTVWNQTFHGVFGYESNGLTISSFVDIGDPNQLHNPVAYDYADGLYFADYATRGAVIVNANIQNQWNGIIAPQSMGHNSVGSTFTVQNSFLDNVNDVNVSTITSSNGGSGLAPRTIVLQNLTFAHPSVVSSSQWADVVMDGSVGNSYFSNTTVSDLVYLDNYNGGNNYQLFYTRNKPGNASQLSLIDGYVVKQ
jgi:hypothetical protein